MPVQAITATTRQRVAASAFFSRLRSRRCPTTRAAARMRAITSGTKSAPGLRMTKAWLLNPSTSTSMPKYAKKVRDDTYPK
jgi:hypothetical protein